MLRCSCCASRTSVKTITRFLWIISRLDEVVGASTFERDLQNERRNANCKISQSYLIFNQLFKNSLT